MPTARIRILCVDDHQLVREGVKSIISSQPDMEVVAAAATGEHAIEMVRRYQPDLTLMDLRLPTMSGLTAIELIRAEYPAARIIVLTTSEAEEDIFNALQAGAATYVFKDALVDDLVRIVRDVYAGRHPLPAKVKEVLMGRASRPALTSREADVVKLIAEGMRDREIATLLGIAEETVKTHVKGILAKFDAKNRSAAVWIAAIRGILRLR